VGKKADELRGIETCQFLSIGWIKGPEPDILVSRNSEGRFAELQHLNI
jgi:hypothetical protein